MSDAFSDDQPSTKSDSGRSAPPGMDEAAGYSDEILRWQEQLVGPIAESHEPEGMRNSLLLSIAREAMACEFEVLLNQHQYPEGTDLALDALSRIESLEQLLSVYQPRSELSTLNRFGHQRATAVSHDTCQLLKLASDIHRWTEGAFDITAGTLSEAWGFSRRQGRKPSAEEIEKALANVGTSHLELDESRGTASLKCQGVQVNPGGIGKGYALDRAGRQLFEAGVHDYMLHGGLSSVVARGDRQHDETGGGWIVALKHPWRWEETLGTIRLRDQALGTSGSGKQFFHFDGKRYSHIIDPRTGWPAQGMMSTTVVCRSSAIADALATAFFVMGAEATKKFCETHPQISVIMVLQRERSQIPTIECCNTGDDLWQSMERRSQG